MQTFGTDRARTLGERVILQSSIPKGWTPRTPKSLTTSEHPGTAVLWNDEYFEVVEAAPLPTGGVRYVLLPWSESHTIRQLERYDAESEALRIADYERAKKQRRANLGATLAGFVLGFLPASVQNHLENELAVRATRMTLQSCAVPLVVLGVSIYFYVDSRLRRDFSPVPMAVWLFAIPLTCESFIRFFVVMSQSRPMGSLAGVIPYTIYRALSPKRDRLPPAGGGRGESVAFIAPSEDVALRGSFEVKEPLLTLLSPAEQRQLAQRFGFDYRKYAFIVAWTILLFALLGAFTSYQQRDGAGTASMLVALAVAIEQVVRLVRLRGGPAGSMFAIVVRPLARNLLR